MRHGDDSAQNGDQGEAYGDASGFAIVGMSGRFPKAPSVEALWTIVSEGKDVFSKLSPEEIDDTFTDEERASENYVPVRPFLNDIDMFDSEFFGMFAAEAAITDPQHRIFLEICWEALESAGYDPHAYPGMIGVFAGSAMPTYLINNILANREKAEEFSSNYQVGSFTQVVGSLNDALATRVAYKLDLRGPAFTVQSACSTSLLAVAQACQNLMTYSCDMALAGGISVTVPQKRGYLYQEGGLVSPDGVCRPFDEGAAGTVFSSGAGVVLIKRLEDALRDKDRIHAVIRGFGVNNDGSNKVSFTAPSARGQADAIATAIANAGVDPATIGYIECHGTATPLGDPIEVGGLRSAFGDISGERGICALGSLKGNIGHMDAAAGIGGLIKAVLALQHRTIPAMANYSAPNPRIDLANSPFYVPTASMDWPETGEPRRAGVSSFGVGGTNVHVILEEAPPQADETDGRSHGACILPLSARNDAALAAMRSNLRNHLLHNPDTSIAQLAYTLQNGRRKFNHRIAVSASNVEEAIERLASERYLPQVAADKPPPVAFMFPGQGAQYVGMGAGLYNREPEFARWIDRGAEIVKLQLGLDLRDYICHTGTVTQTMADEQRETRIAQPCLYLVEYALARLWMSRGVKPFAMIGHGVGEFVAATIANVISFEDALRLVVAQGRLMQNQPQGAMVSVRTDAETVAGYLREGVEIAAINAPKLCVISGSFDGIDAVCADLEKAGVAFSRLHASHAFHSAMMEPAAEALRDEAMRVTYGTATIPYISCVTGDWQSGERGTSPDYWARHCREQVRFADGLTNLCRGQKPVLIEMGPGGGLSAFASQTLSRDAVATTVQSLPEHDRAYAAGDTLAEMTGKLWMAGCAVDWPVLASSARKRIALPTYPFQRQRHWIDAPPSARRASSDQISAGKDREAESPAAEMPAIGQRSTAETVARLPLSDRARRLEAALLSLLSEISGEILTATDRLVTFRELGFDSLLIGQFAQRLEKDYDIRLSFRELLSNIPSVAHLAQHLDNLLPRDDIPPQALSSQTTSVPAATASAFAGLEALMQSQLQIIQSLFAQQLQVLQSAGIAVTTPAPTAAVATLASDMSRNMSVQSPVSPVASQPSQPVAADFWPNYGDRVSLYKPGRPSVTPDLTPEQQTFIANLIASYERRGARSKVFTDRNRRLLADPRTAAGFRLDWKEMIFPVVSDRSKGSRIWDIDGNEYIDLVNGFGQTAFGHSPDFVVAALNAQLDAGYAVGPQTPLAGEVAKLIADMTGHERVTFCNTGSEAVMAAMRVARSVTGRELIVLFANDYHGQFDEVLVKGRKGVDRPVALPIASGIPAASISNIVVLPYGQAESLDWIRANAGTIAATIIEPVQSRHPELRPFDFVRELRDIATKGDFALVFDEVVTGFRVDPGGMQALWGIKGDLATYGKVVGGGMPIGVLAGSSRYMDALDGGSWNYGDNSAPMTAPTFFAGTFVRHPMVLAASRAVLKHIRGEGSELYNRVAERTQLLVAEINSELAKRGIRQTVHGYKSWFYTDFSSSDPLGSLVYPAMRLRGIHIQEHYPCFLTTAHSEEDFQVIASAFRDSLDELQAVGIMSSRDSSVGAAADLRVSPSDEGSARPSFAPMTQAQTEIWLAEQAGDEASSTFIESFSLTLVGAFDEAAFRAALDMVVARHDALHIRVDKSGKTFGFIPDFAFVAQTTDLSAKRDRQQRLERILDTEARAPFNLLEGPLVRARIVRLASDRHVFVFAAHQIICDGWSINVLIDEIAAAYSALSTAETPHFEPALSFADYTTDLALHEHGQSEAAAFWLAQYGDVPELLQLPLDRPRPQFRTFTGETATGLIEEDTYKALKQAGSRSGAALYSTLLAILQIMISKLSDQQDLAIAIPSAGQSMVGDGVLVGHCVNLLPLRQTVNSRGSFRSHLKATQKLVLEAFEHRDYTYETLVRRLGLKRDPQRLPLTEILFNLERAVGGVEFGALAVTVEPHAKPSSHFDMSFNMVEGSDNIRINVDYNAEIFDRPTIERWIGHFVTLAAVVAKDIGSTVSELPMLAEGERNWLLHDLNDTTAAYDRNQFAFSLFSRKAEEQPDAVAAEHAGVKMTYRQLEAKSNQLALFIQMKVPEPGRRVGLLVERSLDMLVSLLAIMKAGHTYVPMDPSHPEARLRQTLDIVRMSGIVCDSDEAAKLAPTGMPVIRIDRDTKAIASMTEAVIKNLPSDTTAPAYVVLTSGSTGAPKGVEVSHRALTNFLVSMARKPGFTAEDSIVAVTTISVDIAGLEMYLPLISGGRVIIAGQRQVLDAVEIVRLVEETGATVMQATPTLWTSMLDAGLKAPRLRMLCGGEPLSQDLARSLLSAGNQLWNMYGPTETTIWSAVRQITDCDRPITIGCPIANTQLYILDGENNIAPVGVAGELHIGGDGLANGYFDRLDLTERAFVPIAFGRGKPKRLYKTGDVGRRLADGSVQLLGRRDQQIRLRGVRIDLGEIETVMSKVKGVRQCAVVAVSNESDGSCLVCHAVRHPGRAELTQAELTAYARANLPGYMVPQFWISDKALPQTPTGKLDRLALERRGRPATEVMAAKLLPRTERERELLDIWQDVLDRSDIGVDDNIYALGADSLAILRIAARMQDAGIPLETKHLIRHPSVADLARFSEKPPAKAATKRRRAVSRKPTQGGARDELAATP